MQTISTPDGQVYQFPDTMSREQMAAAIQARLAKANPDGTGVGRGFVRGALQTAAAPSTLAATADITAMTDKARLASPEGESGIAYEELIRAGVPQGAFASRAANTGSPQQNVAMMQQYGVSPAAQVNYGQVVDKRIENARNVNVADAERRVAASQEPSRLGYSLDQAQVMTGKGLEAIGRLSGLENLEQYGTDVSNRNKQQIEDNGYQSS